MSTSRALIVIAVASLLSALLLAWVSRAPAQLRNREVSADSYDASLGSEFEPTDVARHAAYRGPGYLYLLLSNVLSICVLVILWRGPLGRVLGHFVGAPGGWVTQALIAVAVVTLAMWLATLPLSFVRGYAIDSAWGLSTQDVGGWISDQVRGTLVGLVAAAIAAVAFYGTLRWQPRAWWLVGWVVFTLLTIALTVLWPVLIAPIFNRFTPLEDSALRRRAFSLASEVGIEIDEVLVADASRRTATENAYVAGLGATKRLVLYDTLVTKGDDDATAYVVAHELGHRTKRHIAQQMLIAAGGLLIGFSLLRLLAGWRPAWEWAGASGIEDPRALPVVMLFALVVGLVALPVESSISRHFERQADRVALSLTEDPDTAVRTFRRLAFSNLADLRPHPLAVTALYSHPPISERIESALSQGAKSP